MAETTWGKGRTVMAAIVVVVALATTCISVGFTSAQVSTNKDTLVRHEASLEELVNVRVEMAGVKEAVEGLKGSVDDLRSSLSKP